MEILFPGDKSPFCNAKPTFVGSAAVRVGNPRKVSGFGMREARHSDFGFQNGVSTPLEEFPYTH